MITDKDGNVYLTYKEYANEYRMTEAAVRQLVHRGNIWCVKIGKKPYIYRGDVPYRKTPGRPKKCVTHF